MLCTHRTWNERRLRELIYEQYKMIQDFKVTNRSRLQQHLSRQETVRQLCAKLYDMRDLSE